MESFFQPDNPLESPPRFAVLSLNPANLEVCAPIAALTGSARLTAGYREHRGRAINRGVRHWPSVSASDWAHSPAVERSTPRLPATV